MMTFIKMIRNSVYYNSNNGVFFNHRRGSICSTTSSSRSSRKLVVAFGSHHNVCCRNYYYNHFNDNNYYSNININHCYYPNYYRRRQQRQQQQQKLQYHKCTTSKTSATMSAITNNIHYNHDYISNNNQYRYISTYDHEQYDHGPLHDKYYNIIKHSNTIMKLDQYQLMTLQTLERLYDDLMNYPPTPTPSNTSTNNVATTVDNNNDTNNNSFWNSWFTPSSSSTTNKNSSSLYVPKGVYIYGGVGCGKTFLMNDIFYECLDSTLWRNNKQKVHFHTFMIHIHHEMHMARKNKSINHNISDIIIPTVIQSIINNGKLICFDEFQVTDIADALILQRLFNGLWNAGCTIIATSNRSPIDLYKDGLQRDRFIPFIKQLENNCEIVNMFQSEIDYRLLMTTTTSTTTTTTSDSSTTDGTDDDTTITTTTTTTTTSTPTVYFASTDYIDAAMNHDDSSSSNTCSNNNGSMNSNGSINSNMNKMTIMKYASKLALHDYNILFYQLIGDRTPIVQTSLNTQGRTVSIPQSSLIKGIAKFRFDDICMKALGTADYNIIGQTFHTIFIDHIPILTLNELNYIRRFIILIDTLYENHVKLILHTTQSDIEHIFQPYDMNDITIDKNDIHIDEIFAFDRTKSRLYEMKSIQYLSKQHKRWCGNHHTDITKPISKLSSFNEADYITSGIGVETKASLISNRRATVNVIPS